MIRIDLQWFAKSASQARQYRKAKARKQFEQNQASSTKEEEKKPEPPRKREKGERVTAVKSNEEYEIYLLDHGKEVAVKDKAGNTITRTGKQVIEKFSYREDRGGWISKSKGWKYIIRRKK